MKQKYINANIYRHDKATEFIVENGRFSAIGTDLGHADEIIDVKGKLILPPYVDPHLHLDYYFTGQTDKAENKTGTLFEAIDIWNDFKKGTTKEEMKARMRQAIKDVKIGRAHV